MNLKMTFILAVVAVTSRVDSRPTHCERWKGDRAFRCAKDDYHSDRVIVSNRAGTIVSFKTGLWMSGCGKTGQNYAVHTYSLIPGGSVDIPFVEAGPGSCNEIFIYNCEINNLGVNCLDAVNVSAD